MDSCIASLYARASDPALRKINAPRARCTWSIVSSMRLGTALLGLAVVTSAYANGRPPSTNGVVLNANDILDAHVCGHRTRIRDTP